MEAKGKGFIEIEFPGSDFLTPPTNANDFHLNCYEDPSDSYVDDDDHWGWRTLTNRIAVGTDGYVKGSCSTSPITFAYTDSSNTKLRIGVFYTDKYGENGGPYIDETEAIFKNEVFKFSISGWTYAATTYTDALSFTIRSKWEDELDSSTGSTKTIYDIDTFGSFDFTVSAIPTAKNLAV